jgi:hypothetical protein
MRVPNEPDERRRQLDSTSTLSDRRRRLIAVDGRTACRRVDVGCGFGGGSGRTVHVVSAALAVIVVLGVAVPLAAWLASRRLVLRHLPSAAGFGPPASPADGWLADRHGLAAWQRHQVRQAVLFGRAVADPALRVPARDLAAAVLRDEVKMGRGVRLAAWILLAEAAVIMAAAAFALVGPGVIAGVFPVLIGAWLAVQGSLLLRVVHGGPERAWRRNA